MSKTLNGFPGPQWHSESLPIRHDSCVARGEAMSKQVNNLPSLHRGLAASIGKNTLFGMAASVVQVGARFVTVPIVIAHLGLGGYGIWSIIMTVAAYMRFGSSGIKSAFQKYVAEATGNENYERTNKLLSTGCAAMLVLSLVGLVPFLLYSRALAKHAGVPAEFLSSAAWSISVLAITIVIANAGAAYEGIVTGGHRIDLARKFNTYLCVAEAVAIIFVLHLGYGLLAMALIMAASELILIVCCYLASHQVVPQIHVLPKYVTMKVVPELVRFAGSYQLVGILQITYGSILPIAILRTFGADAAGVLALAARVVSPVGMCQSAFLVPVLSSGAMIYATGSTERMRNVLVKSFKAMLGVTLIPMALIGAFGTYAIEAWTGQTDSHLRVALWLISLAGVFQALSWLGSVLYRVSGRAVLDNIREVLRISTLLVVCIFAPRLGFNGILAGLVLVEFIGMLFMLFAMSRTFPAFRAKSLLPDALKLSAATVGIVAVAAVAARLSPDSMLNARMLAAAKVAAVSLATLVSAYPVLYMTRAISNSEVRSILDVFRKRAATTVPLAST